MEQQWRRATGLCSQLHAANASTGRLSTFAIRSSFFFTRFDETHTPPIVRIAATRGVNLQLYLLILFEAQCRRRYGSAGPSPLPLSSHEEALSWTSLTFSKATENAGIKVPISSRANRERQVRSALKRLADEGLIQRNVGTPPRAVMALDESGKHRKETAFYHAPDPFEHVIRLPAEFVTQGWLYLLTPAEIRFYFAFRHLEKRYLRRPGAYFSPEARTSEYFLPRDVYESHLMLHRLGLIQRVKDPRRRSDGKLVDFHSYAERGEKWPIHLFKLGDDSLLHRPAYGPVRRALLNT
ncbi:hypothetical protein [Kitasatospora cheerisanensis]|uniref:Uncharacterized protein n=1 Tax=Kitasatospora cheerisanensis KCTC 2395 TaxID=1348663 RepID=A0A066Z704_9ACTN|nr:hypothetical protein [Kitasatospora cheerisanensis]KDN85960.1 hypothetical protein KCH_23610 [Kitasatospora cheerisanensis KCTC 2395]